MGNDSGNAIKQRAPRGGGGGQARRSVAVAARLPPCSSWCNAGAAVTSAPITRNPHSSACWPRERSPGSAASPILSRPPPRGAREQELAAQMQEGGLQAGQAFYFLSGRQLSGGSALRPATSGGRCTVEAPLPIPLSANGPLREHNAAAWQHCPLCGSMQEGSSHAMPQVRHWCRTSRTPAEHQPLQHVLHVPQGQLAGTRAHVAHWLNMQGELYAALGLGQPAAAGLCGYTALNLANSCLPHTRAQWALDLQIEKGPACEH